MVVHPVGSKAKFEVLLEADSDEDRVPVGEKVESESSFYEKMKKYVRTFTLTPLSSGTVAGLEVQVSPHSEVFLWF